MNFLISSRNFWASAVLFFLAIGVMSLDKFRELPPFASYIIVAIMILSGLFMALSSSQQLSEGFNSRLNQMGWKDLSKKEQNTIGILILLTLVTTFYFTRHINGSFIFAVIVITISQFAINIYIKSKKK